MGKCGKNIPEQIHSFTRTYFPSVYPPPAFPFFQTRSIKPRRPTREGKNGGLVLDLLFDRPVSTPLQGTEERFQGLGEFRGVDQFPRSQRVQS